MDDPGDQFPYSQFVGDLGAGDGRQQTRQPVLPATVSSVPPGKPIDLAGAAGLLPNVTIWVSHYRTAAEAMPLDARARQLILFPGHGQLTVATRTGEYVCDDRFGVSIETEGLVAVRFDPGRRGAGATVDRLTLIRRLAALIDAPVRRRLTFDTRFDSNSGHQAAVGELICAVLAPTLGKALTASPATASRLSATILDLVLHSLPHSYTEDLLRPPVQIAQRQIRRAIDYVDAHVHPALSVDDLAAACAVSIRSLQYGFRRFLDISPADYIRDVRLGRARRDILQSRETSLTEIAGRWGFANLARFKARFRSAYGETPSACRRRLAAPARPVGSDF